MSSQGSDEDRKLVLSSVAELEDYLSSEVTLWRISNSNLMLTPGNLFLAIARTHVEQDESLSQARDELLLLVNQRRTAWEKKIQKEFPMRLNQWKATLEEYREQGYIDMSYLHNVRVRVILTLLMQEWRYLDTVTREKLDTLDHLLLQLSIPGNFLWEMPLMDYFPREEFGFLYLDLKK